MIRLVFITLFLVYSIFLLVRIFSAIRQRRATATKKVFEKHSFHHSFPASEIRDADFTDMK
ncbi:MAG: hypothetical protein FJ218_05250 [Ignavibacteria bacterium]|nr:hypothetical protein [Ignavibacteria bacterium]